MTIDRAPFEGFASVNYAASDDIACDIATAWEILQDYQAWNPTFVGATVTPVSGPPGGEGEVVRISKRLVDPSGERIPDFYAETVKIVPERHLVWYVFGDEHATFRNFVDFGLDPTAAGCRWLASYYAQNAVEAARLEEWVGFQQETLEKTAAAFKEYCEAHSSVLHP
jgi:hypothetical protein